MIRENVDSSNIRSIGYDPDSGTLEIEFHNGGIYQYFKVPQATYDQLMHTPSHGSYFHQHIRNEYRCIRVN